MKSILMSIQPKYVAKILNGEKIIEIRKRFPKDYRGWVYIYVTKDDKNTLERNTDEPYDFFVLKDKKHLVFKLNPNHSGYNGKVVARFYFDNVEEIIRNDKGYYYTDNLVVPYALQKFSCLINEELYQYLQDKIGYAIHISQLEIFDKPKELSEFYSSFRCKRHNRMFANNSVEYDEKYGGLRQPTRRGYEYTYPLTKAPQSYMFIEVD